MTEKKNAGSMESLGLHSIRGRDRERERERERERKDTITIFRKIFNLYSTLYTCVCSMNTFIKVLEGLTEVPLYFNAH